MLESGHSHWYSQVARALACAAAAGGALVATLASAQSLSAAQENTCVAVDQVQQDTPMWCWLAVTDMVVSHFSGTHRAQCEMLDEVGGFSAGRCCKDPYSCLFPASPRFIQVSLWRFGRVRSHEAGRALSPQELRAALQGGMPVIAQVRMACTTLAHVVVITGIRTESEDHWTPAGHVVQRRSFVTVNDPLAAAPATVPYDALRTIWFGTLVIDGAASSR